MADFCKLLMGGGPPHPPHPHPPQGKAKTCAKRVNKNELCWQKKKKKIFFKLSRPKGNLCGGVTVLNPKYPRLSSRDTNIKILHYLPIYPIIWWILCFSASRDPPFCLFTSGTHTFSVFLIHVKRQQQLIW